MSTRESLVFVGIVILLLTLIGCSVTVCKEAITVMQKRPRQDQWRDTMEVYP